MNLWLKYIYVYTYAVFFNMIKYLSKQIEVPDVGLLILSVCGVAMCGIVVGTVVVVVLYIILVYKTSHLLFN